MVFLYQHSDNVAVKKPDGNDDAIHDVFLSLDRLDYDLFSKVNGFEIVLKQKKLTRPPKR
jgi:hypothetical protein